jgi:hypothetical protein
VLSGHSGYDIIVVGPVLAIGLFSWSLAGLVRTLRVLLGRRPLRRDREGWIAWALALVVSLVLTALGSILVPYARSLDAGLLALAIPAVFLLGGLVPLVILVRIVLPLRPPVKPEEVAGA